MDSANMVEADGVKCDYGVAIHNPYECKIMANVPERIHVSLCPKYQLPKGYT